MRRRLLVVVSFLLISLDMFAQSDTLIYSLKGIEDSSVNTHLFYRAKYLNFTDNTDSTVDFIYQYNEIDQKEKLFLTGYSVTNYPDGNLTYELIKSIDFISNDPNKYIYLTSQLGIDGNWSVSRYDSANILEYGFTPASKLFVSKQDSNKVFIIAGHTIYKSIDGGFTVADSNIYQIDFKYVTFSPFNDSVMFGIDKAGNLIKSVDQGRSNFIIDQSVDWHFTDTILFDRDKQHVYALLNEHINREKYPYTLATLMVSDEKGNAGSWKVLVENSNRINVCIDDSLTGNIFYSEGNEIFKSTDFGSEFLHYAYAKNFPIGIYKKPKKDNLFIANVNGIAKVTSDSTEWLIRKSIKQALTYLPLQIGNKWVYSTGGVSYDPEAHPFSYDYITTVEKDSIFPNGKRYFLVKNFYEHYGNWLRIDSTQGLLYISYSDNEEKAVENFLAVRGDENELYDGNIRDVTASDTLLWNKKRLTKIFYYSSLYTYKETYCQGIGIIRRDNEFDFGNSTDVLKGCVINGVVYGDTTITDVAEVTNKTPNRFNLSQNYPNPFNPATTIKYTLTPSLSQRERVSEGRVRGLFVTLRVYDVLGREIATLVNKKQVPGNYQVTFDAGNLPSGVYFYRLKTNGFSESKKMLLIR